MALFTQLFTKFIHRQAKAVAQAPSVQEAAPARPKADPVEQEYLSLYLRTLSKPQGDEEAPWQQVLSQLHQLREAGLQEEKVDDVLANLVMNFPNSYRKHFREFLLFAGSGNAVCLACRKLLAKGCDTAARQAAEPYLRYLLSQPLGGMVQQSSDEAKAPLVLDTDTRFLLLYARILNRIPCTTQEAAAQVRQEQRQYLQLAARLRPGNAEVWEALAETCTAEEEEAYLACMENVLTFSHGPGIPDILTIRHTAMQHVQKDPKPSSVLCSTSREQGGEQLLTQCA